MKKFLISLISITVIVFSFDFIIGKALDKCALVDTPKLLHASHNDADIALVGASVVYNQYIPSIIEDSIGLSCYNYGNGGQNIYYHYLTVHLLIEKSEHKPQVIIYEPCFIDIEDSPGHNTEYLKKMYSGYEYDSIFKEVIDQSTFEERMLLNVFKSYKHNSNIIYYLKNNVISDKDLYEGYAPLASVWDKPIAKEKHDGSIDENKIKYLEKMYELCRDNDVLLIVSQAPHYGIVEEQAWINYMRDFADSHSIPYIDFYQDKSYLSQPELFYNPAHLNHDGATVFTKYFSTIVRDILNTTSLTAAKQHKI